MNTAQKAARSSISVTALCVFSHLQQFTTRMREGLFLSLRICIWRACA
jgi:hypothetical protein